MSSNNDPATAVHTIDTSTISHEKSLRRLSAKIVALADLAVNLVARTRAISSLEAAVIPGWMMDRPVPFIISFIRIAITD